MALRVGFRVAWWEQRMVQDIGKFSKVISNKMFSKNPWTCLFLVLRSIALIIRCAVGSGSSAKCLTLHSSTYSSLFYEVELLLTLVYC